MNVFLICSNCDKFFQSKPICLPCGYTICDNHFSDNKLNCINCEEEHKLTDCRPCKNIEIEWAKINLENEIISFKSKLEEWPRKKLYLDDQISELFSKLINDVDLRREEVKKLIDDHFLSMVNILINDRELFKRKANLVKFGIADIENFLENFSNNYNKTKSINEREKEIERVKLELNFLKTEFFKDIKDLLGNKIYNLTPKSKTVDIGSLFGRISIEENIQKDNQILDDKTNEDLINELVSNNVIYTLSVKLTMLLVDRKHFCSINPYVNKPQQIVDQTISAPQMHAYTLEYLKTKLTENSKVLDIESGSGYLTACFAIMVGCGGKVISINHSRKSVQHSIENVSKWNKDHSKIGSSIQFIVGNGFEGYAKEAPFDVIHIGEVVSKIPQNLLDQLALGGRMVLPLSCSKKQYFTLVYKSNDGNIEKELLMEIKHGLLSDKN